MSITKSFLFGLLALTSFIHAQEVILLDEVVITDNKLELPRAKKTKRVIRLGSKELGKGLMIKLLKEAKINP